VIAQTFTARNSERLGRLTDSDVPGSMEKKKRGSIFSGEWVFLWRKVLTCLHWMRRMFH
jgi:hypothetical protein